MEGDSRRAARLEEDLTGKVRFRGPVQAEITVGDAIDVPTERELRGGIDPIMSKIDASLRELLGLGGGDGDEVSA